MTETTKFGFTTSELRLLETVEQYINEENWENMVATKLKISPVTVRTKLYRLRIKFQRSEGFNKAYKKWREKLFRKSGGRFRGL